MTKKEIENIKREVAIDFFKRFIWSRYLPKKEEELLKAKYLKGIPEKDYKEMYEKMFGEPK